MIVMVFVAMFFSCKIFYNFTILILLCAATKPSEDISFIRDLYITPHYAVNPHKVAILATVEQEVAKNLSEIYLERQSNHPCFIFLEKYLKEYTQDAKISENQNISAKERAKAVAENPILTYMLIRRFTINLVDMSYLCENAAPTVIKTLMEVFQRNKMVPPKAQDLQESLLGLIRIQYVYGLHASQIQQGIFQGVHTKATLSFIDCIALANKAIELNGDVLAHQWITTATSILPVNQTLPVREIDLLEDSWRGLLTLKGNLKSKTQLHLELSSVRQRKLDDFLPYKYYAPCRGENIRVVASKQPLYCLYANQNCDPYFAINPVKVEKLSDEPLIVQFYEVFGETVINYIRQQASNRLIRSVVQGIGGDKKFQRQRTSVNTFLTEEGDRHPIIRTLNKRIEKITDLEVAKVGASELQVVQYSTASHYDYHHDSIKDQNNSVYRPGGSGNRIATFLMFMNDVTLGGYTAFLNADVYVKPIKGSAILWYNVLQNGETDITNHAGCPVILGEKFVANRWILEYENLWKFPCLP